MTRECFSKSREKIIVALDTSSPDKLKDLVEELGDQVEIFKIGLEQYLASRGRVLDYLREKGKKVFLDLKFHDIPNTMAAAARRAVAEGVWMFNIHVTGIAAMELVMEAVEDEAARRGLERPLVIGVTVLTSLDHKDLISLGSGDSPEELVLKRAVLAKKAGLDGVVSSAREAGILKESCGSSFITVCPGVRPGWASNADQKRIMTPEDAVKEGADYLVIGRPITSAAEPVKVVKKILEEMEGIYVK